MCGQCSTNYDCDSDSEIEEDCHEYHGHHEHANLPVANFLPSRRDVTATFNYVDPEASDEVLANGTNNPHHWGGATKKISHSVTDVTGREKEYTLDNQGFTWVQHKSKLSGDELRDYEKVRAEYWPEVEELVKSLCPGATSVRVYNSFTRVSAETELENAEITTALNKSSQSQDRKQLYRAHVDQDWATAVGFIHRLYPSEANMLSKKRFRIVNIWRPISAITRDPLAVATLQSVNADEIRHYAAVYSEGQKPATVGALAASANHRWCYKSGQRPDEPLVFLQFDNRITGTGARGGEELLSRVPHSAFEIEDARGPARMSIEARAFVFYDEEGLQLP